MKALPFPWWSDDETTQRLITVYVDLAIAMYQLRRMMGWEE